VYNFQDIMLHVITTLNDPLLELIKDDPVRPEIPIAARVCEGQAEVFVLIKDGAPAAVTCVRYTHDVPGSVSELDNTQLPEVAVFYTIWSYTPGAGRALIREAQAHIQNYRQEIARFVTLSPKTEMARIFHHKNGAKTLRENLDTVNYEYPTGTNL
jgi:hypothetical protein